MRGLEPQSAVTTNSMRPSGSSRPQVQHSRSAQQAATSSLAAAAVAQEPPPARHCAAAQQARNGKRKALDPQPTNQLHAETPQTARLQAGAAGASIAQSVPQAVPADLALPCGLVPELDYVLKVCRSWQSYSLEVQQQAWAGDVKKYKAATAMFLQKEYKVHHMLRDSKHALRGYGTGVAVCKETGVTEACLLLEYADQGTAEDYLPMSAADARSVMYGTVQGLVSMQVRGNTEPVCRVSKHKTSDMCCLLEQLLHDCVGAVDCCQLSGKVGKLALQQAPR